MYILFDFIHSNGFIRVLNMVENILNIIRIIVPIGLIFMTSIDILRKIINPEDKEGQKKILNRALAAILVFLSPLLINIFKEMTNLAPSGSIAGKTSQETDSKDNNGNNNDKTNENNNPILKANITIIDCPKNIVSLNKQLSLTASVSNYQGELIWSANYGESIVKLTTLSEGKKLNYTINDYPANGNITFTVNGGDIIRTCTVSVEKPKSTGNVKISNCPNKNILYNKGDSIVLKAEVPSTYYGNLTWNTYSSKNTVSILPSSDSKQATITFTDYNALGVIKIALSGNNNTDSCPLYVSVSDRTSGEINIDNCPKNRVKVGDSFVISTNSNSAITWVDAYNNVYSQYYSLVDNKNGTANVTVISDYNLDKGGDGINLPVTIKVKNQNNQEGYCKFYTYNE